MATSKAEAQRRNYHYMADAMRMLEWDLHSTILRQMRIPPEWHEVAKAKGRGETRRVTLRMDAELVKFFQSMGKDWQPRVNQVLSAWVHARLAGVIDGPETMDYMKRRDETASQMQVALSRPRWGEEHRETEALGIDPDRAWSGEGEGVPMGRDGSEEGQMKALGRVLFTLRRAERGEA